jgi:hypothetical protein
MAWKQPAVGLARQIRADLGGRNGRFVIWVATKVEWFTRNAQDKMNARLGHTGQSRNGRYA